MISQHPEVEAKVVTELDDLGLLATVERPDPRPMEHADLQELRYTLQAIKVTLHVNYNCISCLPHGMFSCLRHGAPSE